MIESEPYLELRLARDSMDLRAAQQLRYRVFVEELGGNGPLVDHDARLERDDFDAYCDHLILVDTRRNPESLDHVVGAYRLLQTHAAERAGGFYSQDEFDLSPLYSTKSKLLELGRSCVDAEYRGGLALFMLWNGLAEYVRQNAIEILFGVASFHGADVQRHAVPLSYLHHHHISPETLRPVAKGAGARKTDMIPLENIDRKQALRALPALIKAYLRIGGKIADGAFVDTAFNTTDVCMVLDANKVHPRHRFLYPATARAA